jgi:hypothetical protein
MSHPVPVIRLQVITNPYGKRFYLATAFGDQDNPESGLGTHCRLNPTSALRAANQMLLSSGRRGEKAGVKVVLKISFGGEAHDQFSLTPWSVNEAAEIYHKLWSELSADEIRKLTQESES